MATYRDSNKPFELDAYLLETMTNYDFNDDQSNPQDRKTFYEFGKERKFSFEQKRRKTIRNKSLIKLLKLPTVMVLGFSTIFQSSELDELCERSKLLLQDREVGSNSDIINEEIVAIVDKLLEHNYIFTEQH